MGLAYPTSADKKTIRLLDVGVVGWAAIWLVLAVVTAFEVRSLRQLSTTLVRSSEVLADTADVLAAIEDIPLVGSRVEDVEASVRTAADSTKKSGLQSRENVKDLSLLLGVLIFLTPLLPVLFLYLPLRIAWSREVAMIERGVKDVGNEDSFTTFLAERALRNLGSERLHEMGIAPWTPLPEERRDDLAHAELERLGLSRRSKN